MLNERDIIFFTPFHFPNGRGSENKFFIVLKKTADEVVLSVLPTSQNHFPNDLEQVGGCHEYPDRSINCFIIHTDEIVTECGKSFEKTTYLNGGYQILQMDTVDLQSTYPVEDVNYRKWGVMINDKFTNVVDCFKKSSQTKRKHQRML